MQLIPWDFVLIVVRYSYLLTCFFQSYSFVPAICLLFCKNGFSTQNLLLAKVDTQHLSSDVCVMLVRPNDPFVIPFFILFLSECSSCPVSL